MPVIPLSGPLALDHVDDWVFDLDNTLYSGDCRLFHQIDRRMGEYVGQLLGLDADAARRVQKDYFRTYGTTLRGLMLNHGVAPQAYLDYVHDIDLTVIPPNPALDAALAALPGRKTIFTNADAPHAERVVERLGIACHFHAIFDIHAAGFVPKPEDEVYDRFIARHAIEATRAALFEDTAANLAPAAARGMTCLLVTPGEAGVKNDREAPHIHHVVDNLAAFLTGCRRD